MRAAAEIDQTDRKFVGNDNCYQIECLHSSRHGVRALLSLMIKLAAFALTWLSVALLYACSPNQRVRSVTAHRDVLWLALGVAVPALGLWIWAEGVGAGVFGWLASGTLGVMSLPVLALFVRRSTT